MFCAWKNRDLGAALSAWSEHRAVNVMRHEHDKAACIAPSREIVHAVFYAIP
jgi:hypothetical protein